MAFYSAVVHKFLGAEAQLQELTQLTLTPAINGIIIPGLAITGGTLVGITVSSLRQRQLDVRANLNKEACDLTFLEIALANGLGPGSATEDTGLYPRVLLYLRQYVNRILKESSPDVDIRLLGRSGVADTELCGMLSAMEFCGVPEGLKTKVENSVKSLHDERAVRIACLSTAFPEIHWIILALLAISIIVCFLVETDQSEGRFLYELPENSFRLRLIFALQVGTFSGLTALCGDLNDVFRGSFNLSDSTEQFRTILGILDSEIEELESSRARVR